MKNEVILENIVTSTDLKILLIGNNPMEVGYLFDKIKEVRSPKINVEIAFNLKTMVVKLIEFEPNYILIDDNIGKTELADALNIIFQKSKGIVPITIIKNSNYNESTISSTNLDYILKQNFSMDLLMYGFKNFLKSRKTLLNFLRQQKISPLNYNSTN